MRISSTRVMKEKVKNASGRRSSKKKRSKSELERSPLRKLDFSVAFSNKKTLRYDDVAARRVCNEFLLTGKSSREDRGDKKA